MLLKLSGRYKIPSGVYFLFTYHIVRFDIRGLSPGSSEDEAGIKEASELCEKFCIYSAHVGCLRHQFYSICRL